MLASILIQTYTVMKQKNPYKIIRRKKLGAFSPLHTSIPIINTHRERKKLKILRKKKSINTSSFNMHRFSKDFLEICSLRNPLI